MWHSVAEIDRNDGTMKWQLMTLSRHPSRGDKLIHPL